MRQEGVSDIRHVFIHAVNPFGFAQIRRFAEDNVDLNRNFLHDKTQYQRTSAGYRRLNGFLNPESPPARFEPFRLKAMWNIWRFGLRALKQSVAGGQYEFPRGIFYGGGGPSQSTVTVCDNCDQWVSSAAKILHIDFHSGLGQFGKYKLLLAELAGSDACQWYRDVFGAECVEPTDASVGTAYQASGPIGEWLQLHFASREYRFVTAEFGTYGPVRVLGAIRAENRAHHYANEKSATYLNAKAELLECFCPRDVGWRRQVVTSGLGIIQQGMSALSKS